MGKGSVGEGREWIGVSVLPAGLVYHKPPSCQYYDRSEMDTVSFAQGILGRGTTLGPQGRGREGTHLLALRASRMVVGGSSGRVTVWDRSLEGMGVKGSHSGGTG